MCTLKEYAVKITETLEKIVCVQAEDEFDAEYQVQDAWDNGECILDADDFVFATFEVNDIQVG